MCCGRGQACALATSLSATCTCPPLATGRRRLQQVITFTGRQVFYGKCGGLPSASTFAFVTFQPTSNRTPDRIGSLPPWI